MFVLNLWAMINESTCENYHSELTKGVKCSTSCKFQYFIFVTVVFIKC